MPKILILDTYYSEVLKGIALNPSAGYLRNLRTALDVGFGTFDAYSHWLRAEGWDAVDIIANFADLQKQWAVEHAGWDQAASLQAIALQQIEVEKPDIVFLQDFSFFSAADLALLKSKYLLAGQCSCPMPAWDRVTKLDTIFTSFPHYVSQFEAQGVHAVYLPLAFDPRMKPEEGPRDLDISFVGGVGRYSHWKAGTDMLEAVAEQFGERFHWYGYGLDNLSPSSALRKCHRGTAWGREMYGVYGRSKIVINRHGEVAQGFSNNLRMYEATGCGALLMTEQSFNLDALFPKDTVVPYASVDELCGNIQHFLDNDTARAFLGILGQAHTLKHHTYEQRMKIVSKVLSERLVAA